MNVHKPKVFNFEDRHRIRVLNTAAIKLKDKQWMLTTIFDLSKAHLLPGVTFDEEQQSLQKWPIIKWNRSRWNDILSYDYTDVGEDSSNTREARIALDTICSNQKRIPFISKDEPSNRDEEMDDTRGLKDFIEFLVDWEEYYADHNDIRQNDFEVIHIFTFDNSDGLPWERGEAVGDKRIKLTAVGSFDLPLGDYPDNIGYCEAKKGKLFIVSSALCLIEVLTDISRTDKLCVNSIRDTLRKETSTLFKFARLHYINRAFLITYNPRTEKRSSSSLDSDSEFPREAVNELLSILKPSMHDSSDQNQSNITEERPHQSDQHLRRLSKTWFVDNLKMISNSNLTLELLSFLENFDENKLESFLKQGILFKHERGELKAVLVVEAPRHQTWNRPRHRSGYRYFRLDYIYSDEIFSHLRGQVDDETRRALQLFEYVKADGGAAKGKISKVWQWLAWIYVPSVVLLSIIAVALNWREADSIWERIFGGVEFATFALIGVFGLVKLVGEDQNAIRNTFLGYVKLLSEDDVCKYTKTQNLPLALALYTKSADWANGDYTCYCLAKTFGGIAVLSGLDMESARMAGIYAFKEGFAVDLRVGKIRRMTRNDDPDQKVFRLGGPVSGELEINATHRWNDGIFRGPS